MGIGTIVAVSAGAGAVGAVGAVALVPAALGVIGFSSAGITAGSYAAGMMSSYAIANGGGVAAGSLVSLLQSAAAAGLSVATKAAVASAGASVAGGVGATVGWLSGFFC
ncbi:interferon alpha-inducible protein 27-like protein 2A [Fundulus heteroclitus]|uniref:interferon alpha-inducible protein 27-like protein 2A n=1 Tax=Fundulus heteroclitus TaxID=8078 RepID=UPI000644EB0D|nr:interferon alpha-inducible protein 27-like protein 2A [Fundulus heteroclitus]